MPFMKGPSPIRRTVKYLSAGRLVFKDQIKIFTVNYNIRGASHVGTKCAKEKHELHFKTQ
ncbi:hypothetical protein NQ315_005899 [Exocentrus adspersus]|uniref:Uncharacterized protein n=1 Tax=Exocentrus adspersus TaxID=1586481 RepID=A0AAV8VBH0_9CUCU|nr:hypothetical protein NQ315_005899 [Exocentrus adspersus]